MKLRFYNRDGRWYADLPAYIEAGGSEADCEMVAGADTWLDFLSGYSDQVTLELSVKEPLKNSITRISTDDGNFGATYETIEYNGQLRHHILWICPVTLFVFGEFPEVIYYEVVK